MSFASSLLPSLARIRAIPGQLGLRPHSVSIIVRHWSGTQTGEGEETRTETPITEGGQPPKIKWLNDEEIAVGGLERGTVEVGPITPSFSGGGLVLSQIDGSTLETNDTIQLRIIGPQHPNGALYRMTRKQTDSALHYTIQAVPSGTAANSP